MSTFIGVSMRSFSGCFKQLRVTCHSTGISRLPAKTPPDPDPANFPA